MSNPTNPVVKGLNCRSDYLIAIFLLVSVLSLASGVSSQSTNQIQNSAIVEIRVFEYYIDCDFNEYDPPFFIEPDVYFVTAVNGDISGSSYVFGSPGHCGFNNITDVSYTSTIYINDPSEPIDIEVGFFDADANDNDDVIPLGSGNIYATNWPFAFESEFGDTGIVLVSLDPTTCGISGDATGQCDELLEAGSDAGWVRFMVRLNIVDTVPPELIIPGDLVVQAESGDSATVTYTVTANDDVDGALTPSCTPPSGSTFFLGTTLVECTATDTAGNSSTASFNITVEPPPVDLINIDIKPGGEPNSINCNHENVVIPVAILTTENFDATTVDHNTVTFEGASEIHVDNNSGEPRRHEEDVDEDGDIDLIFHFRQGDTNLTCDSLEGKLTGETLDGQAIEVYDSVRMVGKILVGNEGGTLKISPKITIIIDRDTFDNMVRITYVRQPSIPTALNNIGFFYELTAAYLDGTPVKPIQPYTITFTYDQADIPSKVSEDTLALYFWDNSAWDKLATSVVDTEANMIVAQPERFGLWGVLADHSIYLPGIFKNTP